MHDRARLVPGAEIAVDTGQEVINQLYRAGLEPAGIALAKARVQVGDHGGQQRCGLGT